jgi:hypothetical protein
MADNHPRPLTTHTRYPAASSLVACLKLALVRCDNQVILIACVLQALERFRS